MCATFQFRGKTYKPGSEVIGSGERGIIRHAWAGVALSEILSWWQKRGAVLIDIPVYRFAERSEVTGKSPRRHPNLAIADNEGNLIS
jgi:hypothetical protein